MIKDDKLPVKIFRFTATISDDVSKRNTEGMHLTHYFTFIEFDSSKMTIKKKEVLNRFE